MILEPGVLTKSIFELATVPWRVEVNAYLYCFDAGIRYATGTPQTVNVQPGPNYPDPIVMSIYGCDDCTFSSTDPGCTAAGIVSRICSNAM